MTELLKKSVNYRRTVKKAVIFIIDNLDLIKKMCENSDMDSEELERQIETAKTAKDYTLLALLSAAQTFSANKH